MKYLSKSKREKVSETHIIGHAHGNNDIAKDTPNGSYLRGVVIR
jgi:hypothetical protein